MDRIVVASVGGALALTGITDEHMAFLLAVGAIVAGYAWLEYRVEKIVRRELGAHAAAEEIRLAVLERKIDRLTAD